MKDPPQKGREDFGRANNDDFHKYHLRRGRPRLFVREIDAPDPDDGECFDHHQHLFGQKKGYDLALTKAVSERVGIPVIASGGAGAKEHFADAFRLGHADAALAASVFHFGEIKIPELKQYLHNEGICVRL